jgi:hypothetical protein
VSPADQYLGLLDFVLLGYEFGNAVTEYVIFDLVKFNKARAVKKV